MARKKTTSKKTAKKQIEFSDGKDHLKEEAAEAQSLEEVLGFKQKNPFKTSDAQSFEHSLNNMALTELQELAVNAGVFPSGTKLTLKNKLIKAFKQYATGGSNKTVQVTKPIVDPNSKRGKDLLKLIQEQ